MNAQTKLSPLKLIVLIMMVLNLFLQMVSAAVEGSQFDPADFSSLGMLKLSSGNRVTFDTSSLSVSGDFTGTGVTAFSESGSTECAIFCFDSVRLEKGVIVTLTGSRPCVILSKSDIVVDTTLDVSGAAAIDSRGAPGHVHGGSGGDVGSDGKGPGDDARHVGRGIYGSTWCSGGGYGGQGGDGQDGPAGGRTYGNEELTELQGGSGGAGGQSSRGGGAGGGAIELIATGDLTIEPNGRILANGGAYERAGAKDDGSGGSGGAILLGGRNVILASESEVRADGASLTKDYVASRYNGAGGGGRIAVYCRETLTYDGTVSVARGSGAYQSYQPATNGEDGTFFCSLKGEVIRSLRDFRSKPAVPDKLSPYTGYYTGWVLPTPKKSRIGKGYIPLYDLTNDRALAAILIDDPSSAIERIAAEEIVARLQWLMGSSQIVLPITSSTDPECLEEFQTQIRLSRLGKAVSDHPDVPRQPEGYTIICSKQTGRNVVSCVGFDVPGLYFAAQTLQQLVHRRADQLVLTRCQIEDWPTYRLRGAKSLGNDWKGLRRSLKWLPHIKFNTLHVTYTTLGADNWDSPPAEWIRLCDDLCAFATPRGLDVMPFVNPYFSYNHHIQISDSKQIDALAETCAISLDQGGRKIMLCMDDNAYPTVPYGIYREDDRKVFPSLAQANVHLVSELHKRLKARFPDYTLIVCPPYYWLPLGSYRTEAETYLRKLGAGIPPEVVLLWTGPLVRSIEVTRESFDRYAELIGRRPFLWDNTTYAHHPAAYYLLDAFTTRFPARFWEINQLGIHINTIMGRGKLPADSEIYRVGLSCVADYLWNPEAYNAERSLHRALAARAGQDLVDPLLGFRDAYYTIYDDRLNQLETLTAVADPNSKLKACPWDEEDITAFLGEIEELRSQFELIKTTCKNERLVEELKLHYEEYAWIEDALREIRNADLPRQSITGENILEHGDAEVLEGDKPIFWSLDQGIGVYQAGLARLVAGEDAHRGKHCAKLILDDISHLGDLTVTGIGLIQGYLGQSKEIFGKTNPERAYSALPLTKYDLRFWMKGNVAEVKPRLLSFNQAGTPRLLTPLETPKAELAPREKWRAHELSFITLPDTERLVVKFEISGPLSEHNTPTFLCVDDVHLGPTKRTEEKWSQ